MAGHKRSPKGSQIPNRNMIAYWINNIDSANTLRDKALVAMAYLTAARITELVGDKKKGIEPLRKYQIEIQYMENKPFWVINNIITLKKRSGLEIRNIGLPLVIEFQFIKIVDAYLKTIEDDAMPLFNITRQRAWQIIYKYTGMYCHFMRHIRNSHLVTLYGCNDHDLVSVNGWTDSKPAKEYVHLDWRDVAKKIANTR